MERVSKTDIRIADQKVHLADLTSTNQTNPGNQRRNTTATNNMGQVAVHRQTLHNISPKI